MALWYQCGAGWMKTSWAKRDALADAYLCCPGPSLSAAAHHNLHVPGAFICGITTSYPTIRPDLWIGMDGPDCYPTSLWWETFPKIIRGNFKNAVCVDTPIQRCPNVFAADCEHAPALDMFRRRNHDIKFVWAGNTFTLALHVLVWMGFRRIYLVGCDLGGPKDYCHDLILSPERRSHNRRSLDQLAVNIPKFAKAALPYIWITSATPDSPINAEIGYTPLSEALAQSAAMVPDTGGRIMHSNDAELCKWGKYDAEAGIVTGCDKNQEWLLDWWWAQYAAHNTLPVAFFDMGMTDAGREWCRQHGRLMKSPVAGRFGTGNMHKPFVLVKSPWRQTIWLELDCEVRGNVECLLKYGQGATGLMFDHYYKRQLGAGSPPDEPLYSTGLIVTVNGDKLIPEWCKDTLTRYRQFRNDGDTMKATLWRLKYKPNDIPNELHRVRCEGNHPEALTMHWSGRQGKEIIRRQIAAGETGSGGTVRMPDDSDPQWICRNAIGQWRARRAKYGSHLPALAACLLATKGSVLELGSGDWSTGFLHRYCQATHRRLVTIESDLAYYQKYMGLRTSWHQIIHSNGSDALPDGPWDVVLVDQNPPASRGVSIAQLANEATFLVCHDSEREESSAYQYDFSPFAYRQDYSSGGPRTTVVSNVAEPPEATG